MTTTSAAGVAWDLSDFYAGPDDPKISADLKRGAAEAESFASAYRGTINVPGGPSAAHMLAGLQRLETLQDDVTRPAVYAALLFNADTSKPEHRNLQQHVEQELTAIRNTLLFFDLEWLELPEVEAQRLIDDPQLAPYRHYLASERRYVPHKLLEAEERIVNEKDVTGRSAWQKLFAELIASLQFTIELDGETQTKTLDEMLVLMRHPDRAVRERAFDRVYEVLSGQRQTLAYIYNTLMLDSLTMDRLRNYADPMDSRHLANEIEPEVVAAMMHAVEQNYDIAHRYFALKAKLLGLPKLEIYDQYAPLGQVKVTMEYDLSRDAILEAFGTFDTSFRDIASMFFDRNWIDAEVRPGKRGGAFCMGYPPSLHPYILCNYTDDLRDVMTVAHELGHGIHFWLARKQSFFNFSPTLPLAETASVFGEMLTFDYLLKRQQNDADKLALICGKIEDSFATIFRQNVLTRFEQAAFAGRKESRLTPEQIGERWLEANGRYYGDAVTMTKGYEWGWSYIPHFINTPFYCYSYVFGNLLVLALLGMYREQGKAFVPRYIALLEAGGSQTPSAMLAALGVDARDTGFWQKGFDELRRLVQSAEELAG
ncbi:MAG: M3 family oligoendopeptidase [Chloroflexaceae bacterium]|nr:M3 family oligoendopeptidase [Chloroflexaceae bacterium]